MIVAREGVRCFVETVGNPKTPRHGGAARAAAQRKGKWLGVRIEEELKVRYQLHAEAMGTDFSKWVLEALRLHYEDEREKTPPDTRLDRTIALLERRLRKLEKSLPPRDDSKT